MPQGPCLAQLLYTLYVNDVDNTFKYAKLLMYANELSIYSLIKNNVYNVIFMSSMLGVQYVGLQINSNKCKNNNALW